MRQVLTSGSASRSQHGRQKGHSSSARPDGMQAQHRNRMSDSWVSSNTVLRKNGEELSISFDNHGSLCFSLICPGSTGSALFDRTEQHNPVLHTCACHCLTLSCCMVGLRQQPATPLTDLQLNIEFCLHRRYLSMSLQPRALICTWTAGHQGGHFATSAAFPPWIGGNPDGEDTSAPPTPAGRTLGQRGGNPPDELSPPAMLGSPLSRQTGRRAEAQLLNGQSSPLPWTAHAAPSGDILALV